ncbi:MAG: hypothetical protein ACOVRP_00185 [Gemmatimonas sp.]|jgi:hypothetical protein
MSLLFRLAVMLIVLFPIAVVVVGQKHTNARDTLRAAVQRTGRWALWLAALVLTMEVLGVVFIGW